MRYANRLGAAVIILIAANVACERDIPVLIAPDGADASLLTNQPPTAVVNMTILDQAGCGGGACWWNYRYDAFQSSDPDGTIVSYKWIENGATVSNSDTYFLTATRAYEFCGHGPQEGFLIVTDDQAAADTACYSYAPAP